MPDDQTTEQSNLTTEHAKYVVTTLTPKNPFTGLMWFNPNTGKLNIYKNTRSGWEQINWYEKNSPLITSVTWYWHGIIS